MIINEGSSRELTLIPKTRIVEYWNENNQYRKKIEYCIPTHPLTGEILVEEPQLKIRF